jgi:uncharacterized protein with HEPN domain
MTKSHRAWQRYAEHIVTASDRIHHFRAKYETEDPEAFKDILYRNLHTIAESADLLPDHMKENYPDIPWPKVKGFRNLMVHDYLGDHIDPKIVSTIVFKHLPELRKAAADMLKRYPEHEKLSVHDDQNLAAQIAHAKTKIPDADQE